MTREEMIEWRDKLNILAHGEDQIDRLYYLVALAIKSERERIVSIVQDEGDGWPHDGNKKGVQLCCVHILHRVKMEGMQ